MTHKPVIRYATYCNDTRCTSNKPLCAAFGR